MRSSVRTIFNYLGCHWRTSYSCKKFAARISSKTKIILREKASETFPVEVNAWSQSKVMCFYEILCSVHSAKFNSLNADWFASFWSQHLWNVRHVSGKASRRLNGKSTDWKSWECLISLLHVNVFTALFTVEKWERSLESLWHENLFRVVLEVRDLRNL